MTVSTYSLLKPSLYEVGFSASETLKNNTSRYKGFIENLRVCRLKIYKDLICQIAVKHFQIIYLIKCNNYKKNKYMSITFLICVVVFFIINFFCH